MTLKVLGSYTIVDELGAGGMGIVYKAVDGTLKRTVAIKVIQSGVSDKSSHLDRFKREAEVIARLRHPNVITLYDYGEEEGTFYYTMEYLEAETVSDLLAGKEGPLSRNHLQAIGEGVFAALEYIHEQGLVHRDVKPGNIMVAPDGRVTLMDFGLVKAEDMEALTKAGAIGTPRYMSPEMIRAEQADCRSDIFQMGLVLFEVATGEAAFNGRDVFVLARSVLTAEPKRPSKITKGLSRYFDMFIANCLAKDVNDRYQSAEEALVDFRRVMKNVPPLKRPAKPIEPSKESQDTLKPTSTLSILVTRFSSTSLARPMFFFRDISWYFKVLFLLLFISFVYFMGTFSSKPAASYRSFDVEVFPDLDAVTLKWKSDKAYPSSVWWKDEEASEGDYIRSDNSTKATTAHSVLLEQLKKGVGYTFKIIYPDGKTSLPYPVKPLIATALEARRLPLRWLALDKVDVEWETNLPCTSSVTFDKNGELVDLPLSRKLQRKHLLSLRDLAFHTTLREVRLTLSTKRHRRIVQSKDIEGPSRSYHNFLAIVSDFKPDHLVVDTRRKLSGQSKEIDGTKLVSSMIGKLKPYRQLRLFKPAISGIFAMTEKSSDDYKAPLYLALRKLSCFDSLLDRFEKTRVLNLDKLFEPYVKMTYGDELPPNPTETIFEFSEMDSSFLPTLKEQRPNNLVANTAFTVMQVNNSFKVHNELKVSKDLSAFMAKATDRPRLVLRGRNMTPEFFVRVSFGRGFSLDFWNTKESMPPTMWGTLHGKNYEQTKLFQQSINSICVSFPKSLLNKGNNRFHVEMYMLPGLRALHYTQLFGLYLYES